MKIIGLLLVAALLSGCDSISSAQYLVRPTPVTSATFVVQGSDKSLVAETLAEVAAVSSNFREITSESKVPNTIAAYEEKSEHFPVCFGARAVGEVIVIDVSQFHPGSGDPPLFKSIKEGVRAGLTKRFGSRFTEPKRSERVPFSASPSNGT